MGTTTEAREKPMLFSGPMVKAILDGKKFQTRRLMKPQPDDYTGSPVITTPEWYEPAVERNGEEVPGKPVFGVYSEGRGWKCPFGAPGQRLWVRETFGLGWENGHGGYSVLKPTNGEARLAKVFYRAEWRDKPNEPQMKDWRPSIFMPRWASRITLEIESVRVEQLQQISEADAMAEGVESAAAFRELWDRINGKKHPWSANEWVWVVAFKRVSP